MKPGHHRRYWLLAVSSAALFTACVQGQISTMHPPSQGPANNPVMNDPADTRRNDPFTGLPNGPGDPAMRYRHEDARKSERKRRMVEAANRLLKLTQSLQADMQGREATPEDEKRLDEIAKLARSVKDQMRN